MDDSPTPGNRLLDGRYELEELLGTGSITEVFRATDHTEHRTVAVKLLRHHLVHLEAVRKQFQHHAYLATRLTHDNIIPVYEIGQDQDQPYLVVEYLPGESLADHIERESPVALDQALKLTYDLASGVGQAHSQGIVHGDLRPCNVLFTAKRLPKVGDFGLVMANRESPGQPGGSPAQMQAYSAPEQLTGEPTTSETDVYALGVIFYELLTGISPFRRVILADDESQFRPDPVWEFPEEVPPNVRRLVLGSIAVDAKARFVDGLELAEAISEAITEERRTRKFGSRHGPRAPRGKTSGQYKQPMHPALPRVGNVAGNGAMGIVLLALIFLALIVLLASTGLTLAESFTPTLVSPPPFNRPSPAVPTIAVPPPTPSVPPVPTPSPTPPLSGDEALVPQLVGLRLDQAEPWLKERQLPFSVKEEHSAQHENGEIISQFPLALQILRKNDKVELVVSLGPKDREIPSVVGIPFADAAETLEELEFKVEIDQVFSDTVAIGLVLAQAPPAGERAASDSTMRIIVSQGPQPATVPNLVGQNFRDARIALGRLGLGAHIVSQPDNIQTVGTVISQFPPGDSEVKKGSTVTLAVAARAGQ